MGKFLGKPNLESFPNAAKKGLKIFSNPQINAVSGYERLYRHFWNRKAEELCRNPSFVKWSKTAITGVIATEWSLKKTALLSNHATRLMDYNSSTSDTNTKRRQKTDTVHQGCLSMLNEHKNLLRLDEELRNLKRPDNTTRNKKKKILAMEEAMQGKISELKKRQEALRKGLENLAKEKQVQNCEIVINIDVNTTQLDSDTIKDLINTIMPQDDVEEGCSGAKGPDEEADSDSAQVTLPAESESDLSAEEGCSGTTGQDEGKESDSPQEVTIPAESESDLSAEEGFSGTTGQDEEAEIDSPQEVTLLAESESDLSADEGCSGATGHDEEAEREQEDIAASDGDIYLSDPSEEHSSGNDDGSEYSNDEGEHSPSRKRAKMD